MSLSDSIIYRLQHQHQTILELVKGVPQDDLTQQLLEGKWSILQNIAHLAVYQTVFWQRLQTIEHTDDPVFERYVADTDPAFAGACGQSLKELLEDITTQRFILVNHLTRLPEATLRRTGRHPRFGTMHIGEWTEFFLLHEAHHLYTIFLLIGMLKTPQPR